MYLDLMEPKVCHSVCKRFPLDFVKSSPYLHTVFFKIYFNSIFPFMPQFSSGLFPWDFYLEFYSSFLSLSMLHILLIFWQHRMQDYKVRSSSPCNFLYTSHISFGKWHFLLRHAIFFLVMRDQISHSYKTGRNRACKRWVENYHYGMEHTKLWSWCNRLDGGDMFNCRNINWVLSIDK